MFGSGSPVESYMHIMNLAPLSTFSKSSTGYMLDDKNKQLHSTRDCYKSSTLQCKRGSHQSTSSIQPHCVTRVAIDFLSGYRFHGACEKCRRARTNLSNCKLSNL